MLPESTLEPWLLDPSQEIPPAALLRSAGVAAYAHSCLDRSQPEWQELRQDYLSAVARHLTARTHLLPLLRVWRDAGIEVLLFKGFALSEFVYPARGVRRYADVDLLMRPEDAAGALALAHALGWCDPYNGALDVWPSHTLFTLRSATSGFNVDVHRWAVHAYLPWNGVHRRITRAVWDRSREERWEGITVRLPDPVDAMLVGVFLQRAWGDGWRLRADHALDLRVLRDRQQVTRGAVLKRAQDLRCRRTLLAFLRQCDPWEGRLSLAPGRADAPRRALALLADRRDLFFKGWLTRAHMLRPALRWVPPALVSIFRVRRALRRQPDPDTLLQELGRTGSRAGTPAREGAIWAPHAVRWAMRLVPGAKDGPWQVPALALFSLLRRRGWPAELVTVGSSVQVELGGRVLGVADRPGPIAGARH